MIDFNTQLKFTPISTETALFRGDSYEYSNLETDILEGKFKYFLNEPNDAVDEQYGVMHEFKTTKNVLLIRLDDKDTQKYLYEIADETIQNILKRNFGYENNLRDTERNADAKMAEFLCNLQIDGYLTDTMNTEAGGSFHREIVICNPKDKLEYVKNITDNERADVLKKEWKLKRIELQDKENRKKKRPRQEPEQEEPGFFAKYLGTSTDNTGYDTPGGAKKKKKNKNKKKKSKKWIKYNKRHTKRKLVKKG